MKMIAALNAINSQVWGFLLILTGGAFMFVFHKNNIDVGVAAGVMGAGGNMLSSAFKRANEAPAPPNTLQNIPQAPGGNTGNPINPNPNA